MVGNVDIINGEGMVPKVSVQIQKHVLLVDCIVLPVKGVDLILGVQWMQHLGPILLNYQDLTIQFNWYQETIRLQGERNMTRPPMSLNYYRKVQDDDFIASMFHIALLANMISNHVMFILEKRTWLL